jgi:uncharacterized protein YcbK (DUF882 family)
VIKFRLSKHFSRSEFACKCGCGFSVVDGKLLEVLEAIRTHFGKPITINSGCRCADHNSNVGGAKASKHLLGIAADIVVKDIPPAEVYDFVVSLIGSTWGGVGKYNSFTHIDSREDPARWDFSD